jgi:hypothetical protein
MNAEAYCGSLATLKIVSGGQTGADRAALDWARAHGVPHGGWCPKGRGAEDGPIGPEYRLEETPSADPAQRTEWNVRDSDGTVIFSIAEGLSGGSRLTAELAERRRKPCLHLVRARATPEPASALRAFQQAHRIRVLNVAGPRALEAPEIGRFVEEVLTRAFSELLPRGPAKAKR